MAGMGIGEENGSKGMPPFCYKTLPSKFTITNSVLGAYLVEN
jgi:hypothetical protein